LLCATVKRAQRTSIEELARRRVRRKVQALPQPERAVIRWRFGLCGRALTLREVAARLSVSCSTAHTIEQRGIAALRRMYGIAESDSADLKPGVTDRPRSDAA
jgi:DNA-directed RNA polymerase sigma subunit (sigma70/sigma32)